jgi:hypothetical protein
MGIGRAEPNDKDETAPGGFDAAPRPGLEGRAERSRPAMTSRARIYRQPKTAMQSGLAGSAEWIVEFEPAEPRRADPLMGWTGSADTQTQVRLRFASRDEAVAYAERGGLAYDIELPQSRRVRPKAYADNFRFGRPEAWTH